VLIGDLWQIKIVVFLDWCLIGNLLLPLSVYLTVFRNLEFLSSFLAESRKLKDSKVAQEGHAVGFGEHSSSLKIVLAIWK